jgi:hypothetical protein
VIRHVDVDLARQFNEARAKVPFFRFPGKIKRIDRNAVPAQPGTGIKGLKPKRLGGSRVNHFPDIESHAQRQQLEFVDQRDIDAPVDIFQELGHFGGGW